MSCLSRSLSPSVHFGSTNSRWLVLFSSVFVSSSWFSEDCLCHLVEGWFFLTFWPLWLGEQFPKVIISYCCLPKSLLCRWSWLGSITYRLYFQLWWQEENKRLLGQKGRIKCWSWILNQEQTKGSLFLFPQTRVVMTVWFCVSVWFRFCSVFDFSGRGLNMKATLLGISMATDEAQRPLFLFLCFHLGLSHNLRNKILSQELLTKAWEKTNKNTWSILFLQHDIIKDLRNKFASLGENSLVTA